MWEYIISLDPKLVGKVVVFSDSAITERAYPSIASEVKKAGLRIEEDNFYCRRQFTALHRGRPNNDDLKNAAAFAKKIMNV